MPNPFRGIEEGAGLLARLADSAPLPTYKLMQAPQKSFDMYHGSPHDFQKFDWSKLGSGEGHAAYGLGFYGAQNPGIALRPSGYANRLSVRHVGDTIVNEAGSDPYDYLDMRGWNDIRPELYESSIRDPKQQEFLDALQQDDWLGYSDLRRVLYDLRKNPLSNWDPSDRLKDAHANLGYNYKLRVHADQDKMFDWDTELYLQHPSVISAVAPELRKRGLRTRTGTDDDVGLRGSYIYKEAAEALGGRNRTGQSAATAMLRDAGVPGIKYLDGNSRSAGYGTRNYVIFDDSPIEILKKWSLAPPVAAGALSGLNEDR
jgi:hypothetical protein